MLGTVSAIDAALKVIEHRVERKGHGFILKAIVFTAYKREYMNIHTINSVLATTHFVSLSLWVITCERSYKHQRNHFVLVLKCSIIFLFYNILVNELCES